MLLPGTYLSCGETTGLAWPAHGVQNWTFCGHFAGASPLAADGEGIFTWFASLPLFFCWMLDFPEIMVIVDNAVFHGFHEIHEIVV